LGSRPLEYAWLYKLTQRFWYKEGQQQRYIQEYVRPRCGDRVLDIGCGPGEVLKFMPEVDYLGFDPNPRYIDDAIANFGKRGRFRCDYLSSIDQIGSEKFDIVMFNDVLHHLSNSEAGALLRIASGVLREGGRLVSRDGCYELGQNIFERWLLDHDRGKFVRDRIGYEQLLRQYFEILQVNLHRKMLRLPYSLIIFECVRSP
jgi:SAM-dependent methyltransferase